MTCKQCGTEIVLVPIGKGKRYKWVSTNDGAWKCGHDPAFPVLGHAPVDNATKAT